jgi:hypothetical protein
MPPVNRSQISQSYADPLRSFAKTKDTSIIDAYAAKTLFGNVDQLIPVSEAFLADLEVMLSGHGPGVGDVAIKHVRSQSEITFNSSSFKVTVPRLSCVRLLQTVLY